MSPEGLTVRRASAVDRVDAFAVRRAVFIDEQRIDAAIEFDGLDDDAVHFVVIDAGRAVGTARLRVLVGALAPAPHGAAREQRRGKVERVAVLAAWRRRGVGRLLMRAIEEEARRIGLERLELHAQESALPFYRELGYVESGAPFAEAGIPHRAMSIDVGSTG